jgi:ribosomal protein S27E
VKTRCASCDAEVELVFAPAPGGIQVTCPACRTTSFVPASAPGADAAASAPPAREGETTCPKCGEIQPVAAACRRCGLVFARWTGGAAAAEDDAEATRLWAACEAGWDDPSQHDAFIAFCHRRGDLPLAAGRYRAAGQARGAKDSQVTRALARIEKLALTTLELSAPRERRAEKNAPYRNALLVLAALLVLVALGLVWAVFKQQQRAGRAADEPDRVVPVTPVSRP